MACCLRFLEGALFATLIGGAASTRAEEARVPRVEGASQADQRPIVHASGLVQIDAVTWDQRSVDALDPGSRAPLNEDRFVLRRAWAQLGASYAWARGYVLAEASSVSGPNLRVLAAELILAYPRADAPAPIELGVGLFLLPFGFETSEPVVDRMFLEPSTWVEALLPGRRDLGARIAGSWMFLRYAVAVTNGNPSNTAAFPLRDPNRAKDVLGRVGIDAPLLPGVGIRAGLSALLGRGFHAGTQPTKDSLAVRDVNEDGIVQVTEVQLVPGDPGEPPANFARSALGGDLSVDYALPVLGAGRAYGELAWAQNLDRGLFVADPVATGRDARELGWMVGVRQHLTGHGEVGVRWDRYQPDRDASDRRGARVVPYDARFETLAVALAWCSLSYLRFTLEYDHRTNPLGRSLSGRPTTLSADSLIVRGQLRL